MRSGLFLPRFDALADPALVARLAAEAEEAGWHGVFVWDHLRWREPVVDFPGDAVSVDQIRGVIRDGPSPRPRAR
jgi:alkanesulfonate monooxygenase SsuD/methylene tetrahydromethanopterin reductase-like flavin-dependent oxidoreductase (luciferase family)